MKLVPNAAIRPAKVWKCRDRDTKLPETDVLKGTLRRVDSMGQAQPFLGRFASKFLLMVVPGVAASAVAVFVLYAVHVSRPSEPVEWLATLTPQSDGLSTEERRELTRQMLKARRENPQEPAQVRPTPALRPSTTGIAEDPGTGVDAKARADRTPAAAPVPAARPAVARAPAAAAPAATASVTPPPVVAVAPAAPPAAGTEPTNLPPVVVNASPPGVTLPSGAVAPEPPSRGIAATVFSGISTIAGTAANATGNTVNWVIDLPGRAISAGGKLLGGDSASNAPPPPAAAPPPPAAAPPPPAAPPAPKRNYL
jgi:hypothetical protein